MILNIWTFLFEVVNFLVLVYVLRRLLYGPLQEAIARRTEANSRARTDADRARAEAEALRQQLEDEVTELDRRREEMIRSAREQIEAERKKASSEAEEAARRRLAQADRELERDRAEALRSLRSELVGSALAMAERVLREASGATLQARLADRLVQELRGVPAEERGRLRGEWDGDGTAVVETAAELDGETVGRIEEAVTTLAGRAVGLAVQSRPELVGGLRLRIGGHVWDASLANVLGPATEKAREGSPS